jgi:hypothetical protein
MLFGLLLLLLYYVIIILCYYYITDTNSKGNLARQESVSMVPALLLDVKPHHIVCISSYCLTLSLILISFELV